MKTLYIGGTGEISYSCIHAGAALGHDITVFNRLRRASWWRAPLVASVLASALDTALFFSLAFAGLDIPWITLAIGDLGVKLAMAADPVRIRLHR